MRADPELMLPLAVSALAGLAVGLVCLAWVPRLARRRQIAARLERVLEAAEPKPGTSGPSDAWAWLASSLGRLDAVTLRARLPYLVTALVTIVTLLLTHDGLLTLAAALQAVSFSLLTGQELGDARRQRLDAQTVPTLLRLSASLRAGASLLQAIEGIARDGLSPTREEFARTVREVGLGSSIDDALRRLGERVNTSDYRALAVLLGVQRRAGGNLALALDQLTQSARERVELRLELAALTSQQRLSSWILVLLPFAIAGVFWLADHSFLTPLVGTLLGRGLILVASLLLAIGSGLLRRVATVEF
jgi:tight adherence protein B